MKSSTNAEEHFWKLWAQFGGQERAVMTYLAERLLCGQLRVSERTPALASKS